MGKRQCVGEGKKHGMTSVVYVTSALARMELFLILATLLINYRFNACEPVDLTPIVGQVLVPRPYKCVVLPLWTHHSTFKWLNMIIIVFFTFILSQFMPARTRSAFFHKRETQSIVGSCAIAYWCRVANRLCPHFAIVSAILLVLL